LSTAHENDKDKDKYKEKEKNINNILEHKDEKFKIELKSFHNIKNKTVTKEIIEIKLVSVINEVEKLELFNIEKLEEPNNSINEEFYYNYDIMNDIIVPNRYINKKEKEKITWVKIYKKIN
jgi:hypothetical protein